MKKEVVEVFECHECGKEIEIDNISYEYVTDLETQLSETEEKLKEMSEAVLYLEDILNYHHCLKKNDKVKDYTEKAQNYLEDKE